MKLNICIDIDGTITEPFYWLDDANRYFKTDIKPNQVKSYSFNEALNISKEDYFSFYNIYYKKIHFEADIRENAKSVIWNLHNNHNISYVTARELKAKEVTLGWFKKHDLPTADLYMLGSHYKVEKAKELKCDIFIEDRYENALELTLAGFKVLLLDCPYNRNYTIPGMIRVFNWNHIFDEIDEHLNKVNKESVRIA